MQAGLVATSDSGTVEDLKLRISHMDGFRILPENQRLVHQTCNGNFAAIDDGRKPVNQCGKCNSSMYEYAEA